jgi:uncharacterized protein YbaA (DUF1428 family)
MMEAPRRRCAPAAPVVFDFTQLRCVEGWPDARRAD